MPRRSEAGLTLLEMMVVLMITAMALTLGFQSLGQWQRADATIAGVTSSLRQMKLIESWLRGSVRGLAPVEQSPFEGTASNWSGITLDAVFAGPGGATAQQWAIVEDPTGVSLQLTEAGQTSELPLPLVNSARFVYLDPDGSSQDRWPPALGTASHLPAGVGLELDFENGRTQLWISSVAGVADPVYLPFEMEQD